MQVELNKADLRRLVRGLELLFKHDAVKYADQPTYLTEVLTKYSILRKKLKNALE